MGSKLLDEVRGPNSGRVCRIVADEHGKVSTEWIDAPPDHSCPTVELTTLDAGLSLEPERTEEPEVAYDPYSNPTGRTHKRATRRRVNLRRLSESIKTVRGVKQAKPVGSDDD